MDEIKNPPHYHRNGIDVIGFSELQFDSAELKGFYRINALKYVTRYHKKGTPLQDLQKAKFYIDKLIQMEREDDADEYTGV